MEQCIYKNAFNPGFYAQKCTSLRPFVLVRVNPLLLNWLC